MTTVEQIVHAVHQGQVLCDFSRGPRSSWPEGHRWAPVRNVAGVTCKVCKATAEGILRERSTHSLEDADVWQERESEQQQLWEEIISSLHHQTGDGNENYPKVFGAIAQLIIWHITDDVAEIRDNPIAAPTSPERIRALRLYILEVEAPIRAFVGPNNEEERKFILGILLERYIVTIRTPSSNAYNAKLLLARRK